MAEIYNEQRVVGVVNLGDAPGSSNPVGATDDAAWDGVDDDATAIAILKAIHAQNAQIISLLDDIKTNTSA